MQLEPAADDPRVRRRVRVGLRDLLKVVDVFDLGVRTQTVVVTAEVGLPVRQEDGLVVRAAERRHGEVPPLCEHQRRNENEYREGDVALEASMLDEPSDRAPVCEAKADQRDGLGLALGRAVVAGGTVAEGIWPDLNFLIKLTMSPSSRRFSMKRI